MRTLAIGIALLVLCAGPSSAVPTEYSNTRAAPKSPSAPVLASGGESFADATPIPALPFSDTGTTCGAGNDFPFPCSFDGGAPDRVYSFHPTANMFVNFSLCGFATDFDTGLYIYRNSTADLVACSDDVCGLASDLPGVPLTAGNTYYVVVDGYANHCGNYSLDVTQSPPPPPPCAVQCPPGGTAEGEPCCFDGYLDKFNAGCNTFPATFADIAADPAGVTVCGTYGVYDGGSTRDTDWYKFVLTQRAEVRYCATCSQPTITAILD